MTHRKLNHIFVEIRNMEQRAREWRLKLDSGQFGPRSSIAAIEAAINGAMREAVNAELEAFTNYVKGHLRDKADLDDALEYRRKL